MSKRLPTLDSPPNLPVPAKPIVPSHATHLRSFLPAVWEDGIARMSGGLGVLLAFLAVYFAFIANHSIAVLWLAALVACVFASYHVYRRQQIALGGRVAELEGLLKPSFVIDYRPAEGEPFVQREKHVTQYRVGVMSPSPLTDAELVVNDLKVLGYPALHDLHLRPMHDREPRGTKRVNLQPFKEKHWDVVSEFFNSPRPNQVILNCLVPLEGIELPVGSYEFELMVSGGTNPPATKMVSVQVFKDRNMAFEVKTMSPAKNLRRRGVTNLCG